MNLFKTAVIGILMILCCGCSVAIEDSVPDTSGKVAVCHKGKTIYVDESAVNAHLGHGDYLGTCL